MTLIKSTTMSYFPTVPLDKGFSFNINDLKGDIKYDGYGQDTWIIPHLKNAIDIAANKLKETNDQFGGEQLTGTFARDQIVNTAELDLIRKTYLLNSEKLGVSELKKLVFRLSMTLNASRAKEPDNQDIISACNSMDFVSKWFDYKYPNLK